MRISRPRLSAEWISGDDLLALQFADGFVEQADVGVEADRVDVAVLLAAQQVAGAAQFQIERGDLEAGAQVAEFLEGGQALAGDLGQLGVGRDQQVGIGAAVRPAHASAQLIQLREAVALGILDDHGVGERNIQAIFDNCGTNQDIELVAHELEHGLLQFGLAHLAVAHADPGVRAPVPGSWRARAQMESTRLCRK